MMVMTRSYQELRRLETFEERFSYLKLEGEVGRLTFGFDRYVNQRFYTSPEWKHVRHQVIMRDQGCDLGVPGYDIHDRILIHHMNPISLEDILHHEEWILDPNFLITTTKATHNEIHYGVERPYPRTVVSRTPNDTKLW